MRLALSLASTVLASSLAASAFAANVYDFETPTGGVPGPGVDYVVSGASYLDGTFAGVTYAPLVTGVAGDGVAANGSAFGFTNAPQGVQVGFIQILGSISIDPTGLTVGHVYDLSFYDAARYGTDGDQINITGGGGGGPIGSFVPVLASFSLATYQFTATGTSEVITFAGVDPTLTDQTTALDEISVTPVPVPEPAAWAMMLAGFGAVGSLVRARRTKRLAEA